MNFYQHIARPLLFQLDPETAHRLTLKILHYVPSFLFSYPPANPIQLMGIEFPNRLGLAAGLDKNGEALRFFDRLGLGHLEIGTVTPKPQQGNPRPRLFRLPEKKALINRMGFNNDGVEAVCQRIEKVKPQLKAVIGVNIGKNKITPNEKALDDYVMAFQRAEKIADYITVNISSPNTAGLRELQHGQALKELLAGLKIAQLHGQKSSGRYVPLVVKIAPDNDATQLHQIIDIIGESEVDGIITTNTTIDKTAVEDLKHGQEEGGLSGQPLREKATAVTRIIRSALPNIALIAAGGVFSPEDMQEKLEAGADLVQIYSGLIYQGTRLVKDCLNSPT